MIIIFSTLIKSLYPTSRTKNRTLYLHFTFIYIRTSQYSRSNSGNAGFLVVLKIWIGSDYLDMQGPGSWLVQIYLWNIHLCDVISAEQFVEFLKVPTSM